MTDSTNLESIQSWMQNCLIYQGEQPLDIGKYVMSSDRLDAQGHLSIYKRSYYSRLLVCMQEQYPALSHALGENLFNDFTREYLVNCPSESYTLYELGRRFPAYLQSTRPDRSLPFENQEIWVNFMMDLASFERQVFVLFDNEGSEADGYAKDNTDDIDLQLQKCFALGQYYFPVADYYHAVRRDENPELPKFKQSNYAFVRRDYLTGIIALSEAQYLFLESMSKGMSVSYSLELISKNLNLPIDQVRRSWAEPEGIRKNWIDAGIFTQITGFDD